MLSFPHFLLTVDLMCYCLSFEKCIGYVKVTATTHVIDIVDQLLTRHSPFAPLSQAKSPTCSI